MPSNEGIPCDPRNTSTPKPRQPITPTRNSARMMRRRRVVPRVPYMSAAARRRTSGSQPRARALNCFQPREADQQLLRHRALRRVELDLDLFIASVHGAGENHAGAEVLVTHTISGAERLSRGLLGLIRNRVPWIKTKGPCGIVATHRSELTSQIATRRDAAFAPQGLWDVGQEARRRIHHRVPAEVTTGGVN